VAAPIGLPFHSPRQLFANAAIRWAPSASMCSVEAEPDGGASTATPRPKVVAIQLWLPDGTEQIGLK
jgi:hypothetical protein